MMNDREKEERLYRAYLTGLLGVPPPSDVMGFPLDEKAAMTLGKDADGYPLTAGTVCAIVERVLPRTPRVRHFVCAKDGPLEVIGVPSSGPGGYRYRSSDDVFWSVFAVHVANAYASPSAFEAVLHHDKIPTEQEVAAVFEYMKTHPIDD